MNPGFLGLFRRLWELRRDRSAARARKATSDFIQSEKFAREVEIYSGEYSKMWVQSATDGADAATLLAKSAFAERLRATSDAQAVVAERVGVAAKVALSEAHRDWARLKALDDYLARRARAQRAELERKEQRDLDERFSRGV